MPRAWPEAKLEVSSQAHRKITAARPTNTQVLGTTIVRTTRTTNATASTQPHAVRRKPSRRCCPTPPMSEVYPLLPHCYRDPAAAAGHGRESGLPRACRPQPVGHGAVAAQERVAGVESAVSVGVQMADLGRSPYPAN